MENKDVNTSKRCQENRIRRVVVGVAEEPAVRFSLNSYLVSLGLRFRLGSRPLLPPGVLIIETQLRVLSLSRRKL